MSSTGTGVLREEIGDLRRQLASRMDRMSQVDQSEMEQITQFYTEKLAQYQNKESSSY